MCCLRSVSYMTPGLTLAEYYLHHTNRIFQAEAVWKNSRGWEDRWAL